MLTQLLAEYRAAPNSFDELLDANQQPRAHWRDLLGSLAKESPHSMRQRLDAVESHIRENGVTYNVYVDAKGVQRPWDLNPVPLILPHEEWAGIEAAVTQRATLLNQILGDVYGEQRLLQEGLLPPALVHGHSGFLRPAHGIRHPDDVALHFYAVDLARAPDGQWWVLADRTQAPSGAGYALENRAVIARTFPNQLRDLKVQELAGFFRSMRDSLAHWGRQCAANGGVPLRGHESPLIVLLTPGPYNETYYEQAYLARYLGLPLVEGGDLTVRDGIVWLKSLSGLQRVHVIMRRVDDDFCDPLEMRTESALGVAGLTESARLGNVLIANSLGSNLLESGALLGFLPELSQRLLGEPLQMPSVATWWCGEPAALEQVLDRLDQLVIKPSFPQLRQPVVFGQDLNGEARAALIAKMRATPRNYVAQELVRLSQSPVWKKNAATSLSARAVGLRVYACATPDGYVVMPGGLTRVATGPDSRIITMQLGGSSKDTWVQGHTQVSTPRHSSRTITSKDLIRDDTHLSSRMAENLFWLGRNSERCESIARMMRVTLHMLFNVSPQDRGTEWPTMKALCAWFQLIETPDKDTEPSQSQSQGQGQPQSQTQSRPAVVTWSDERIETAMLQAVVSPDVPGLANQQLLLYNTASQLRERLATDNWRALSRMLQQSASSDSPPTPAQAMSILDEASTSAITLSGFALDGMTRDLGWSFLSIGRRLERLQFLTLVLQRALDMDADGGLEWLLELCDSIVTYRSRYRAQPEWLPVLDLLLLDSSNPRSVLFQMEGISNSLNKLALSYDGCNEGLLEPLTKALLALDPDEDLYCGNAALINLLRSINNTSAQLSEQLSARFFSYTAQFNVGKGPA